MICRITGLLESMDGSKAVIAMNNGFCYEVLLPAFVQARLGGSLDQQVTLHTLHFLEGNAQGSSFTPRLAGFMSQSDKAFFELFTSVKGIGPKKALRAMSLPSKQIAIAIAERDAKLLQSLPEIGKRTAETIIASLHGKVDAYIQIQDVRAKAGEDAPPASASGEGEASAAPVVREALEILTQLGENRVDALKWIDQVLIKFPEIDDSQELIARVFEIRSAR